MAHDRFIDLPSEERGRPVTSDAARISRMEEAFGRPAFIPPRRATLRRRARYPTLANPLNDCNIFSWQRTAKRLGTDLRAVQRWHAQEIEVIVAGLRSRAARAVAAPGLVAVRPASRRAVAATPRREMLQSPSAATGPSWGTNASGAFRASV